MTALPIKPAARQALWLLGLDAAGALALGIFVLLYHRGDGAWFTASDAVIGAGLQGVWIVLFIGFFRGDEADSWNGWYVAYRALFPLLIAWRVLLYLLTLGGVLSMAGGLGTVSWLVLLVA